MTTYGSVWASAWMPDGRSVALNGFRVLSLETGQLRHLTTTSGMRVEGRFPAVSPDGTAIAFARPSGARFTLYRLALSTDGTVRGEPQRLADVEGDLWGIAWTPDSRDLVFASGKLSGTSGNLKSLWRVAARRGAEPAPVPVGNDVTAPTLASRGERLAFVQSTVKVGIRRVAPEGGGRAKPPTRFAYSTRNEWNPQYSPADAASRSNPTGRERVRSG
jgi:Tol biopolymer transport system component